MWALDLGGGGAVDGEDLAGNSAADVDVGIAAEPPVADVKSSNCFVLVVDGVVGERCGTDVVGFAVAVVAVDWSIGRMMAGIGLNV